ncbi:MAG: hypothetical protein C4524_06675 [Candidatus Zixiibacteriota bacterium]|nr:MAG: hypothetical protein C4524_06675 [candidate division Zixibacteria bacterium]
MPYLHRNTPVRLVSILFAVLLLAGSATAQEPESPDLSGIPQPVMEGLKARFPQAEIRQWSQEEEGGIVVYDFEFIQDGQKLEADVKEDGSIFNWEKAIAAEDLPGKVKETVTLKYPEASLVEIMEITAVNEGKEALEGYEIVLKTAADKEVEVMVAPDGKILEEDAVNPEAETKPQRLDRRTEGKN